MRLGDTDGRPSWNRGTAVPTPSKALRGRMGRRGRVSVARVSIVCRRPCATTGRDQGPQVDTVLEGTATRG